MDSTGSPSPIPFYGGKQPEMFEIERRCMDRDGVVTSYLQEHLPKGLVLDIGAGNGFVAKALHTQERTVIPMEPDAQMVDHEKPLLWVSGVAQALPFHKNVFDGVYSTWAFFLPGVSAREEGLSEVRRVLKPKGKFIIVDNAGGDEFTSYAGRVISDDGQWYTSRGFSRTVLDTSYRFDSLDEARTLIGFYFGQETAASLTREVIEYKVAVYELSVD